MVVNAGGMFAKEIGALAGVNVPVGADGARVPDHEAVGPSDGHAHHARPVAPRVLPSRVRRADHGRLRAPSGALGARDYNLILHSPLQASSSDLDINSATTAARHALG